MNLLETLRVALRALLRNKTRSLLTTLGIIIGVASVIAMVAIGEGAKSRVQEVFNAMGTHLFILQSGSSRTGGAFGGAGTVPSVTWDDVEAIRSEVPAARYVSPQLRISAQIVGPELNWNTSVFGVSPEFFSIRNWSPGEGVLFTDADADAGAKVVVLGSTVSERLFGVSANPVGQIVRIKGVPFEVIGQLTAKGQSPMGQDLDDSTYVPLSVFRLRIQGRMNNYVSGSVMVSARSESEVKEAIEQVSSLLRERHRIEPQGEDDFSIRNLSEVANAQADSIKTLSMLLASIATVSLIVGGLGIMNIMLVSVTERTREIGLRMAVGARPRDIRRQFLIESLVLASVGGVFGVGLGVGAAIQLASSMEWPLLLRADIMLLALTFSSLVGVIFGLYPAYKASQLDPIQALRYE